MKGMDVLQKAYHKKSALRKTFLDIDESKLSEINHRAHRTYSREALLRDPQLQPCSRLAICLRHSLSSLWKAE